MSPNEFFKKNHGKPWIPEGLQKELFSIIVPTYNRAHTIIESLDTVYAQTYRPVEVIIVNDGSTDNTEKTVKNWMQKVAKDTGFHCQYFFQENAGVCAARNHALRKSKGEFIQFLDSDDLIHPDRLEKLVKVFQEENCDYIETGFEGFTKQNGEKKVLSVHNGHVGRDQLELLLKGRLWPNTLRPAYTRKLINATGPWNEQMITFQDYEYVIRAIASFPTPKLAAIKEVLASARRDGERMSDIFLTHKGRSLRIHCETVLADQIKDRKDIDEEWKRQFVSRIYALGFRSNAMGWMDLGKKCGEIAKSIPAKLDVKGKTRYIVWRMGKWGGKLYQILAKILKPKV